MIAAVIGAGVVGLAAARSLARAGHEVIVIEREPGIGTGSSSRNSEVLHAGLYYAPGSLKARHCVAGRRAVVAYAEARGIAVMLCGKLIVATEPAEVAELERLHARGLANGVEGLSLLSAKEARALEPQLHCVAALHSAATGIIDSHGLLLALRGEIEDHGGAVAFHAPVSAIQRREGRWEVAVAGPHPATIAVDLLVNAAGHGAWTVAAAIEAWDSEMTPPRHLAKGSYFALRGRAPFRHLIYPAPVDGGLGVHLTLDLAGRARFGPDVEWLPDLPEAAIDYRVDSARAEAFETAIRRFWPALPPGSLDPDYAGVRTKTVGPGSPPGDFVLLGPEEHGLPGLVQLFGIESPGLTAALSLGEAVKAALAG